MSTVGNTSSVLASVGTSRASVASIDTNRSSVASIDTSRTSVQIAVPTNLETSDAALEATIQRISTTLYLRSHCLIPRTATDMGGGLFNVVV